MKPEILARALDVIVPKPRVFRNTGAGTVFSQRDNQKRMRTGTTIVAFPFSEGLIFAADRKTSGGYFSILSLETIKVHEVAPFTAIGGAGLVSDIQHVVDMMTQLNQGFIGKFEYPLSVKGQARYLANYLRDFRYYIDPFGLEAQILIGGLSLEQEMAIFEVDVDGSLSRMNNFAVIGSGTNGALGVLREYKKKLESRKMTLNEGIDLAVKSISRAGERDNGTSDIRVADPFVAKVTVAGYEVVEPVRIAAAVKKLLNKESRNAKS